MSFSSLTYLLLLITLSLSSQESEDNKPIKSISTSEFIIFALCAMTCILFSGLMSGLTVGLLSMDELELELKVVNGTEDEKINAKKILIIVSHHHLLLVTLLLANAIAVEALPLFLDAMFSKEIDIVISTTLVLIFGEILPNSILTGNNKLRLAAKLIPIIKVLIIIFLPLSYPIAKLLDCILGTESSKTLKHQELKKFLTLHEEEDEKAEHKKLDRFQIDILHSIIDMKGVKLSKLTKPLKDFARISIKAPVTKKILNKIIKVSYNYALIYNEQKYNIVGIMNIKELFKIYEGEEIEGSDILYSEPVFISEKFSIRKAIKTLDTSPLGLVYSDRKAGTVITGVLTSESITEYLMKRSNLSAKDEIGEISRAIIDKLENNQRRSRPSSFYRNLN